MCSYFFQIRNMCKDNGIPSLGLQMMYEQSKFVEEDLENPVCGTHTQLA